jgi:hypothetical protein
MTACIQCGGATYIIEAVPAIALQTLAPIEAVWTMRKPCPICTEAGAVYTDNAADTDFGLHHRHLCTNHPDQVPADDMADWPFDLPDDDEVIDEDWGRVQ